MSPYGTLGGQGGHRYSYMLTPELTRELLDLGIDFRVVTLDGETEEWPCLVLPSGKFLMIMRDDEGNGPGVIHLGGWVQAS
jgi:hypothetical protein